MTKVGGIAFCVLVLLSTITGSLGMIGPFFPLLLLRPSAWHLVTTFVGGLWFWLVACLLELVAGIKIRLSGDVPRNERVLLMSNHRTRIDWMLLWCYATRMGIRIGQLRIILKEGLKRAPFAGWAMQTFLFIFLKRKWEEDQHYVTRLLTYFRQGDIKTSLLIFPEGTDLSESNVEKSHEFAKKQNLPLWNHVLLPRHTGFMHCLQLMRDNLDAVYDVTMAYKDYQPGERPNEKSLVNGRWPREVHFLTKRYPISEIPKEEEALKAWMLERFREKEQRLAEFYARQKEGEGKGSNNGKPAAELGPETLPRSAFVTAKLALALLSWVALIGAHFYAVLVLRGPFLLMTLAFAAVYYAATRFFNGMDLVELALWGLPAPQKVTVIRAGTDATTTTTSKKKDN